MREIKFRCWGKNLKIMRPIHGLYLDDKDVSYSISDETTNVTYASFDEVKIMQYIGLKDINGKEIYEGDILHFVIVTPIGYEDYDGQWIDITPKVENGIVVFKDGCFQLKTKDNEPIPFLTLYRERFEVIGNIYENPGLLKD